LKLGLAPFVVPHPVGVFVLDSVPGNWFRIAFPCSLLSLKALKRNAIYTPNG